MRCRKARSFLSAYCDDELGTRQRLVISEHLSTCAACRREESIYRSMMATRRQLTRMTVRDDFNTRLLNRIAQERFAETRSRAYLPKPAPVFNRGVVATVFGQWRLGVPALVSVGLLMVLMVVSFWPQVGYRGDVARNTPVSLDDSYLTAQPVNNPNMTSQLTGDWSLAGHLAQTERITQLSNSLARGHFSRLVGLRAIPASTVGDRPTPFVSDYYKVRPRMTVYAAPKSSAREEASEVY